MALRFYRVPKDKIALLPLGYDPDILSSKDKEIIRSEIRAKNLVMDDELLVIHGGKLNEGKKTIELIQSLSVARKKHPKVKLLLFGGIAEEYKKELLKMIQENEQWITYLGPQKQTEYYDLFLASDLAVFPGGQSSLWQEAIGCGLPILVYRRDGFTEYLNRCGNADFFSAQDFESLVKLLDNVLVPDRINAMRKAAGKAAACFSYERIAVRVIKDYKVLNGGKNNKDFSEGQSGYLKGKREE